MKGNKGSIRAARLAGAVVFALSGIPAQAQTWNMYQNQATQSFFVPFVTGPKTPDVQAVNSSRAGYVINNRAADRGIRIGLTAENTAGSTISGQNSAHALTAGLRMTW